MTERLAFTLQDAADATGLSKSHFDRAIRAGQLRAKRSNKTKDGEGTGRLLILAADLRAYLDALADA